MQSAKARKHETVFLFLLSHNFIVDTTIELEADFSCF